MTYTLGQQDQMAANKAADEFWQAEYVSSCCSAPVTHGRPPNCTYCGEGTSKVPIEEEE